MNRMTVALPLVLSLVLSSTGCVLGYFDEPASWSGAREKLGSLESELGTGDAIAAAWLAVDAEVSASVGLSDESAHVTARRLERAAQVVGPSDCSQFVEGWPLAKIRIATSRGACDALAADSLAVTQLGVFMAVSILYGDISERMDLIDAALNDEQQAEFHAGMDAAYDAIERMAQLINEAASARALLDAVIAETGDDASRLNAHELTHVVQQGSTRDAIRAALSADGKEAMDYLLAIFEAHDEVLGVEPDLRTSFAVLLGTLDGAAESLDACQDVTFPELKKLVERERTQFSTISNVSKARHDIALNAIRNMK
jgi:hypothetical protein